MSGFKDLSTYADLAELASRTLEDGRSTVFNANTKFIPQIIEMMSKEDLHWEDIFIVELEKRLNPGGLILQITWKALLWFYKGDKPIVHGRIRNLIKSERPEGKDSSPNKRSQIEAKHVIERFTGTNMNQFLIQ